MTKKLAREDRVWQQKKEQVSEKLRISREVNETNRARYRAIRREDAVNEVAVAKIVKGAQDKAHGK